MARTLIGGQALTLASDEIANRLEAVATSSDTLLAVDPYLFLEGGSGRVTASCTGSSCDFTSGTETDTVDISTEDFEGDEYQAVMTHRGVSIVQLETSDPGESYAEYDGLLDHSVFGVTAELGYDVNDDSPTYKRSGAFSYGDSSGTNPSGSGTATWTGVMVGVDTSAATLSDDPGLLQGDAGVTVDFGNADVDVAFTNVFDLDTRQRRADADMAWTDISIAGGAFRTGSGTDRLEGRFYGPSHEEVGGVFERNRIIGAFGASGGGAPASGGAAPAPGGVSSAIPDFRVEFLADADDVRTLIGGSDLDRTSGDIGEMLQGIVDSSDTLLYSDVWVFSEGGGGDSRRLTSSCTGGSCTHTHPDISGTAAISDFEGDLAEEDEYWAIMTHRGIPIAIGDSGGLDHQSVTYQGWMDHSLFLVEVVDRDRLGDDPDLDTGPHRSVNSFLFGGGHGRNPGGSGTAIWTGVMVGVDISQATATSEDPRLLQGDAGVTVDFDNVDVDVEFTNVFDLGTRQSRSGMSWTDIPMSDGSFQRGSGANQIEGGFYGPNQREVAGVFERDQIVGAFGASNPDYPVDAEMARTRIGGQALTLAPDEIDEGLEAVARGSDTLLAVDPYLFLESGSQRGTASCTGSSCDFTSGTETDTVDISTEEFDGGEYRAVMTHRGVSIVQSETSDPGEVYTEYDGWLDHNVFGVTAELGYDVNDDSLTYKLLRAFSYGDSSGTNPTGGTATWSGVMIGVDVSAATLSDDSTLLQGDAGVTVDFGDVDVAVAFTNVLEPDTGQSRSDMSWADIPMTNGAFETGSGTNRLEGRFYGSAHEEVGGVFERDRIIGAFGAERD